MRNVKCTARLCVVLKYLYPSSDCTSRYFSNIKLEQYFETLQRGKSVLLPVVLSLMSLQLSTSPRLEKRDLISSCVIPWGR